MQYLAPKFIQKVKKTAKLFYQHIEKLYDLFDNLISN